MAPKASNHPVSRPDQIPSLRRMTPGDLTYVTAEHSVHFPENAMGRLGRPFLRRYYRTFLDGPDAVATIAEIDGTRCGYVVGILDTGRHRQRLLRHHGAALGATALLGTVLHPRLATALLARRVTLRLRRLTRGARPRRLTGPEPVPGRVAVLSHIAVSQNHQSRGAGQALMGSFVDAARAAGADRISLATVEGPAGAGPFYERHGWKLQTRRQTFDGRWIRLYDLVLDKVD